VRLFDRLCSSIRELSQSLSAFICHYDVAEAIAFNTGTPAIAIDDFFYYCIAKGSKHIRAAMVLMDNEMPEDAIVVSRAAYECYVSAAYARTHGVQAIDDLVYNPVGLDAGTVEYARTKTGKWDYRRLIDKETEALFHTPPSIERMVLSTGYRDDAVVHRYYYGFSSQHAHVNMAGSGNYRDGAAYTDHGDSQRPNAIFLAAYITAVIVGLAIANTDMDEQEKAGIERELRVAVRQINEVLDKHFKELTADFVAAVKSRLDQTLI
jgi:hypothetical protein